MSAFFRAAALMDTTLVDSHHHNPTKGFDSFCRSALSQQDAIKVDKPQSDSSTKPPQAGTMSSQQPQQHPVATHHLQTHHIQRPRGLRFSRSLPTLSLSDQDATWGSSHRKQHPIDVLHEQLRDAILGDLDEDLRRRILAQELNC